MFLFQSPSIFPLNRFLQFAFYDYMWVGLIFGVEADEYVAFAEALGLRLEL